MHLLIYDHDTTFLKVLSEKLSQHYQVTATDSKYEFNQSVLKGDVSAVIYNVGGTFWLHGKTLVQFLKEKGIGHILCYADLLYEAYDTLYPQIGAEYCKKNINAIVNTISLLSVENDSAC